MKTINKYFVIVLMTLFFSTTISIAQNYDFQNHGFTLPLENQRIAVSGVITQEPQKNTFGKIKDSYKNFNFQSGEIRNATIGRHLGAVLYAIVKHGYAYDPGFNGFNFDDETADISNITAILLSPEAEVREITYADFKDYWETPLYIGDEFGNSAGSWANTLGIKFRMVKVKDLLGQKILFYNCKAILHMGNGSPIAMNDPTNFDFETFKKDPETGEPKWGYKDTVITKMMPGTSFSDTPIAKPKKQDPKASDLCPPAIPDPNAVRQKELENDLGKTRDELASALGEVAGALDQIIEARNQTAGISNELANVRNEAAQNLALAELNFNNKQKELEGMLDGTRKQSEKDISDLRAELSQAEGLREQAKADAAKLGNEMKYVIANQQAKYASDLSKIQSRQDSITRAQTLRDQTQDNEISNVKTRVTKVEEKVENHEKRLGTVESKVVKLEENDKRHDADIVGLKKADEEHRAALKATEQALRSEIANVDTKLSNELKTTNAKLTLVEAEAAKAKKRADDAFTEAQTARKEAAEAKMKAADVERKFEEQKLLQKLIDAEQDRKNAADFQNMKDNADKAAQNTEALKNDVKDLKERPIVTVPQNTNPGKEVKNKKPKNVKYVYGPNGTVTITKEKVIDNCPTGDCGTGKVQASILYNPQTGETKFVPIK